MAVVNSGHDECAVEVDGLGAIAGQCLQRFRGANRGDLTVGYGDASAQGWLWLTVYMRRSSQ